MLIVFEGIDGSGKSTQAKKLYNHFQNIGINSQLSSPFKTNYGSRVRKLYLQSVKETSPLTQVFLLASAVHQLVIEQLSKMMKNQIIILDRYIHSTFVYHGIALGVDLDVVKSIYRKAIDEVYPDFVFLLDVSAYVALKRLSSKKRDIIERFPIKFHEKVRQGFLHIAKKEKAFFILDGTNSPLQIHKEIVNIIKQEM